MVFGNTFWNLYDEFFIFLNIFEILRFRIFLDDMNEYSNSKQIETKLNPISYILISEWGITHTFTKIQNGIDPK